MSEPPVGTGRLFRSLRAEGAAADIAVPALSLDQAVGLRTVTLGTAPTSPPAAPATPAPAPAPTPSDPPAALDSSLEYAEVAPRPDDPVEIAPAAAISSPAAPTVRGAHAAPGVRPAGVWLVVIGVTVVMGFADALVVGRTQLGWLTGISLLAASIYGALVVRREDAIIAVIAPPLAFFLATVTAGQLTLPPTGDLLVREAFMIITTLGANAIWV
ncbi:MAG: DUF6542 domain-containing protein, partial [Candidatus Nanopelagicales bacterium]